jgi:putative ABC transport system permease protein
MDATALRSLIVSSAEQAVLYAFLALGVYLSFRILRFPDLTVEGSFPLGGAVAARLLETGTDPGLAMVVAAFSGAAAGVATALIHTRLRINNIIASILVATAAYTVMLRVMGKANTPLLTVRTLFGAALTPLGLTENSYTIIGFGAVLLALVSLIYYAFLKTDIGLAIRASGDNARMARSFGIDPRNTEVLALALSNGLAAISGALVAQLQGFADVGMGIGILVVGAASVIIGETLLGAGRTLGWVVVAVILGVLTYRLIAAAALRVGLAPTDLKLITAVLLLVVMGLPQVRKGLRWSE